MSELFAYYLAMTVYLVDGTPLPQMFILKPEEGCNFEVAQRYARQHRALPNIFLTSGCATVLPQIRARQQVAGRYVVGDYSPALG